MKRVDVPIAIIRRGRQILICRRSPDTRLGGYWEFPGGKVEPGETIEQALERELHEELAIEATPTTALATIEHDYPDIQVRLHPFICIHRAGEPQALACDEVRWIAPADLCNFQFPPANADLLAEVMAKLAEETT